MNATFYFDRAGGISVVKYWLTTAALGEGCPCWELHWPFGRGNRQGILVSSSVVGEGRGESV